MHDAESTYAAALQKASQRGKELAQERKEGGKEQSEAADDSANEAGDHLSDFDASQLKRISRSKFKRQNSIIDI